MHMMMMAVMDVPEHCRQSSEVHAQGKAEFWTRCRIEGRQAEHLPGTQDSAVIDRRYSYPRR
jgi:hypothetical protein